METCALSTTRNEKNMGVNFWGLDLGPWAENRGYGVGMENTCKFFRGPNNIGRSPAPGALKGGVALGLTARSANLEGTSNPSSGAKRTVLRPVPLSNGGRPRAASALPLEPRARSVVLEVAHDDTPDPLRAGRDQSLPTIMRSSTCMLVVAPAVIVAANIQPYTHTRHPAEDLLSRVSIMFEKELP